MLSLSGEISHNCGLVVAHTLHDVYSMIKSLQHRGREATGIAAIGNDRIDVIKWKGPVDRFDLVDLYKMFLSPNYHTYMAHVRYATRGRKDQILEDAHPHTIGGIIENRGSHTIISDCEMAIVHNGQTDENYFAGIDKSLFSTGCDSEALLYFFRDKGEHELLRSIPGSYTLGIADKRRKDVIVLRDKTGIKPGVLGLKDGKFGVSSEDIAFRENRGEFIEDLKPGHVYYLSSKGNYRSEKVVDEQLAQCFFEWNWFAHHESIVNGVSVRRVRETEGEMLAQEFNPEDVDYVTYLPRAPEAAARRYAEKIKKPFLPVFYKMRSERAFQGSTDDDRKDSIEQNLHLIPRIIPMIKGKVILSIDDSTVRGNNSKRERELFYEVAKVKKAYHVNYTPPIGDVGKDGVPRGCTFGVDMPPDDNFIARGRTLEQISREMKMPVFYLSMNGMLSAYEKLGILGGNLCTYCIGGEHPFKG